MDPLSQVIEPDRRWYRNPDFIASSLLVLLGVLFFADVLFTSKNFYFRDILNFHYPLRKVLIDSYARGEWPLWNPYVYLGQPMLANPNYMAFYPSNLFHLFLPFNYAFKLHFVIHPILASLGVYFLQRRLSLPPIACFGGAVVYAFSGIVLSFLNLYNFVPSVALLPWIGWALLNALDRRTGGSVLLFGLLLAFQILSFDLFIALCDLLLLISLALVYVLQSADKARDTLRILRIGLLGGLFAVGLAAIQILPTLELVPLSVRGTGFKFGTTTLWSLHPMDLLNLIVPNLFGYPFTLSKRLYWGEAYHFGREGYLVSFFVGIGSILMALLSAWSVRRRTWVVFVILGLLSAFLALGRFNPWWAWLYSYLPVFRTGRYPVKLVLTLAIAISLLTALGLEVLLTRVRNQSRWRRAIPLVAVALVGVFIGLAALSMSVYCEWHPQRLLDLVGSQVLPELRFAKDLPGIARQLVASLKACGTYAIILSAILIASLHLKRPALGGLMVILALCAESMPQNLRLAPMISEADVDYVSPLNKHLAELGKAGTSRVMAMEGQPTSLRYHFLRAPNDSVAWNTLFFRNAGLPFYGIMEGIQYSLYIPVDGLSTSESNVLFDLFFGRGAFKRTEMLQRTNSLYTATVDRLDIPAMKLEGEYATGSDMTLKLYRLGDTLDRAFFVSGVQRAKSSAEALTMLLDPAFPIGDTVILEAPFVSDRAAQHRVAQVRLVEYRSQSVLCETSSDVPGYLVLLDSYYPGWACRVDGRNVPILRANYCFRAVELPAGKHRVEFRYRPRSFYAGLAVSLMFLMAGVGVLCRSSWKSSR